MSLRTPLSQARGLGSAQHGVGHWWMQRLTAIALVPLSLWFVASIVSLAGAGYGAVTDWIACPPVAIALVIYLGCLYQHSQLGLQVVIEDYVHHTMLKWVSVIAVKFLHVIVALIAIFAVLHIAFGG